jgi:GTP-binding protein
MEHSSTTTQPDRPLVALVGPTNAGKSTLFNRLTGSWQAVTAKEPSTTRDRVYGEASWQRHFFDLVDTGGLVDQPDELDQLVSQQMTQAIEEANVVVFVFDARDGLNSTEQQFINRLRATKKLHLVANKVDSREIENKLKTFDFLGLPYSELSAATGRGVGDFLQDLTKDWPAVTEPISQSTTEPTIAIIGRPNVGKSSLLNALVKTQRAVVSPVAGTTRDIVTEKLTLNGRSFLLTDTAGVRRRGKIEIGSEKFSVRRTLTAISQSDAVVVIVDATEGTTRGDLHLIYFAESLKKPVLVVFNKVDLLTTGGIPYHQHLKKFEQTQISAEKNLNLKSVTDWILQQKKGR